MLIWLIVTISVSAAQMAAAGAPKSASTGVYTDAQASSGEAAYFEHCSKCHGADLAGMEQSPALAGGTFSERWKAATLDRLFDKIESMPPTQPRSLTANQYADLL
ncbi:MAG: cytochrome c, partial [Acidobacteriota bacterium]